MSYLHRQSIQYKAMTPEQKKEYLRKAEKRPPTTELQRLAQKENFALFQLAGIAGNINQLYNCPSVERAYIKDTLRFIKCMQDQIKYAQLLRKVERDGEK